MTAPNTRRRRSTPPIPISASNRRNASSARAACAPARKFRERSRSRSSAAASSSKVATGGVDFLTSECVSCGACVQACPTATLNEKPVIEKGTPERTVVTTCAYCGVGCSFKAELKGDEVAAHGPLQGRQGQRGPFLRQGPVRLRLRHPQGPHPQADDPQPDRGSVARSLVGRGHRLCRERIQAHPGAVRARLGRSDLVLALHRRGSVPGPEDGARRVRQQQYRHLRARLPLADRLRPLQDFRHVGGHAGLQVGREVGRRRRDRRQPDRRASGVRVSPQEAAARRRPPHRYRPAPHRSGQDPACRRPTIISRSSPERTSRF